MKRIVLFVLFVLGMSLSASAQSTVSFEAGKTYNLTAPQDCVNVTAYKVIVDKAQVGADLPSSACANGTVTTPVLPALPAGVHTFAIDTYNSTLMAAGAILTATALTPPSPAGVPTIKVTTTTVQHLEMQPDGTAKVSNISSSSITEKIR